MNPILAALRSGKSSKNILNFISQLNPSLGKQVATAMAAGKTADEIIKYLSKNYDTVDPKGTHNPFKQALTGMSNASKNIATTAGLAAGAALGYGAYRAATRIPTIYPSQILPAQTGMARGATRALGGPPTQLGLGGPQNPMIPQGNPPPIPQGGAPTPNPSQLTPNIPPIVPQSPEMEPINTPDQSLKPNEPVTDAEKAFMASEKEIQTLWDMAKSGKVKVGGPADEFLKTANKLIKSGDIQDYDTFKQFRKWWKTTEGQGRGKPLVEFELFRNQTSSWTGNPKIPEMKQGSQVDTPKGRASIKDLKNKVATVAFEGGGKGQYDIDRLKPLSEARPKAKEYANALYKAPHETEGEFEQRKIIHTAAKKAAKEIMEGKTFLDLPTAKGASKHYSTAVDVLQFMAGIPNAYNDLLDDDEKQELFDASGMMEGLRPSKLGDRDIHGAQLSPNMVWNMLVSVEPKLTTMKRPMSQKKSGALKSGEMGSAEFRRQLTHTVYGILSGKNISTELSDKINKISTATSTLDKLVSSFKDKKLKETEEELEKLQNDEYFSSLFTDEIEDMIRKLR